MAFFHHLISESVIIYGGGDGGRGGDGGVEIKDEASQMNRAQFPAEHGKFLFLQMNLRRCKHILVVFFFFYIMRLL